MADDKEDNKTKLIIQILILIGVIITAFATIISSDNLHFISDKIFDGQENSTPSEQLTPANVLYSHFHEMNAKERYMFGACVALNDSIEAAKKIIPTGTVRRKSLNTLNESLGASEQEYGNNTKIDNESLGLGVSKRAELYLTGDGTFSITPQTPAGLWISDNNPGHNYATWMWLVEPRIEGFHTLLLTAYAVDDNGKRTQLDVKHIPIEVIVTAAAEAASSGEAVKQAMEKINQMNLNLSPEQLQQKAEEELKKQVSEQKQQPGFEAALALLAVLAVVGMIRRRN
jgi:PGF-CTERM protein